MENGGFRNQIEDGRLWIEDRHSRFEDSIMPDQTTARAEQSVFWPSIEEGLSLISVKASVEFLWWGGGGNGVVCRGGKSGRFHEYNSQKIFSKTRFDRKYLGKHYRIGSFPNQNSCVMVNSNQALKIMRFFILYSRLNLVKTCKRCRKYLSLMPDSQKEKYFGGVRSHFHVQPNYSVGVVVVLCCRWGCDKRCREKINYFL